MKNKIVTFSFDDGIQYDRQMVELLNRYGLKCTFNLNTGIQNDSHYFDRGDRPIEVHRMTPEEMKEVYHGHEIATHTLTHPDLRTLSQEECDTEIGQDIQNLKAIFGIRGVPCCAYPYGWGGENAEKALRAHGVRFARTTKQSEDFGVPSNLLEYAPSCYYRDPNIFAIIDRFLQSESNEKQILCIWGHSYEPEGYREWGLLERIFQKLAHRSDVDYLTNGEAFLNDDSGFYR